MTTRQKQRQAELESRCKMFGVEPSIESIHDTESDWPIPPVGQCPCGCDRLIEYRDDWRNAVDNEYKHLPLLVVGPTREAVAVKPYFSIVNMLTVACAVMVVAALVSLIVFGRVQP